ncbi:helix-turn-helix domain-containing protein [Blautia sp. Marseille-P3087]|uniref:helix-turn-helix domain-containing protein n=1 Tax=Blautia sp. Marseille-P3087 TaxID=1917876 RepID=UPI000931866A|nr:helix-turn-helix transcriptional regulator [Blautia sp. Marseille-P3087]
MKIILDIEMAKRNLSVRQVSRMTGIPASTISDIMNERSVPRMDTMELLAKGLRTRISDLYESPYK